MEKYLNEWQVGCCLCIRVGIYYFVPCALALMLFGLIMARQVSLEYCLYDPTLHMPQQFVSVEQLQSILVPLLPVVIHFRRCNYLFWWSSNLRWWNWNVVVVVKKKKKVLNRQAHVAFSGHSCLS